jgi:hypothetical protein
VNEDDDADAESNGDDSGICLDTASVAAGESDVASFSPASSPGVLDLPVATDDSDEEDGMVNVSSAVAEDSAVVAAPVGGIHSHGDRLGIDDTGK